MIIDQPRILNEIALASFDGSDEVILLLSLDIPAIRTTKRVLEALRRLGYDQSRIRLVINRFVRMPELELKQVERVPDSKVFATISNDYQAAITSLDISEPLVMARTSSKITGDIARMAVRLQ